jgi:hypothetical protein
VDNFIRWGWFLVAFGPGASPIFELVAFEQ